MSHLTPLADPVVSSSSTVTPAPPKTSSPPAVATPSTRLQSLDVYRGLIMTALAFNGFGLAATARNHMRAATGGSSGSAGVAAPDSGSGFWGAVYHQFEHVEWIGCSFWDLIQPSFMFMVGVSMAYSYVNRQRQGHSYGRMFGHALWRGVILVALGIFLISNSRPTTEWMLTNVLTQIGLGYPLLFLLWGRSVRVHAIAAVVILLGTCALYLAYPKAGVDLTQGAPSVGVSAKWAQQHLAEVAPAWHKNANVGSALDLWLLNQLPRKEPFHFNVGGYVTLNFLPSLATMLFGLMCGELLRSSRDGRCKFQILLIAGVAGLALGWVGHALGVPLVKRIWTPSWALFSTGWCCLILAALYGIVDLRGWRAWSFPLLVVGMNSIAIYVMGMTLKGWTAKTMQTHFGPDVFRLLGPLNAPFVQATLVGLVFWLVCFWMYRRKIFLRI